MLVKLDVKSRPRRHVTFWFMEAMNKNTICGMTRIIVIRSKYVTFNESIISKDKKGENSESHFEFHDHERDVHHEGDSH